MKPTTRPASGQDSNDQISEAITIAVGSSINAAIDPNTDVDMFHVTVTAGQRLAFDIDGPGFDSWIRLFDSIGTELAHDDNGDAGQAPGEQQSGESYLAYTFSQSGSYYLGVSGFKNDSYKPLSGLGDVAGTTGNYTLRITNITQVSLVPWNVNWRYEQSGVNFGNNWTAPNFSDNNWAVGQAPLAFPADEPLPLGFQVQHALPQRGPITSYFRYTFDHQANLSAYGLTLSNLCDDGCVVYLNGQELWRFRMPNAAITDTTLADLLGESAEVSLRPVDTTIVSAGSLANGLNVLAVEVHQVTANSTDIVFAGALHARALFGPVVTDPALPSNVNVLQGRSTTLRVAAAGFPPPTFQWYYSGSPLFGETGSNYTISSMTAFRRAGMHNLAGCALR